MKVIGLDLGTTGICGVVMDASDGRLVASKTVNSEAFLTTPNPWEKIQDTEKIIKIAKEILDSFLRDHAKETVAIGLTGQMHGILYVDREGRAVSPLYTWQDGRGNLPYGDTTYAGFLGSCTGYGNVTDFYNRENGLVPEEAVAYCTVHDYLGMVLCGNREPILHTSDAASLGLFNSETMQFAYDCRVALTDGFSLIGSYEGIPVSVAIGDNQASVFSTLAGEDELLINIGTGSQISLVSDHPIVSEYAETRPYVDGKYLIVGAALCGGRAYSLLKDFYGDLFKRAGMPQVDVYRLMEQMLAEQGESTLKVDPRFAGTRRDPSVTGAIRNVTVHNLTPRDLTVGMAYGMIGELYDMYRSMGVTRYGIVGSGNGIRRNRELARIAEKMFGGKLRTPLYTEEAACGAALFALVACGAYGSASEVQRLIQYKED